MAPFLIQLAWAAFFQLAAYVLAPDPGRPEDAKAQTADDVDAPNIDEGATVPVILGSVLTGRQNVSWYGGVRNTEITQQGVVTGHRYYLSAQLSLCHGPVSNIREVRLDDHIIPADKFTRTEGTHFWDYQIDAPELLGGEDEEGGLSGRLRVWKGTLTQPHDAEMATLVGTELPAWRGICYAVMRDMYLGTSVRLKPLTFLVENIPNRLGVTGGIEVIGSHRDANAVCALFEVLNDDFWGAALPASAFDLPAWRAAAQTAFDESLGISLTLTAQSVEDAVEQIRQYLDAVVYEDPETGLITLKLIRETDLAGAPTFGDTDVRSVKASRTGWSSLSNTVKVTFTDPTRNYETGGVMALNSAAVAYTGGAQVVETRDASGFTNRAVAQVAAERALRSVSYPISKVELTGNRRLAALRPGSSFRLQWSRPTIDAYYRVASIEQGELASGEVTVTAIEDVFAAGSGTFTPPPASGWEPEQGETAKPVTLVALLETPYHLRRSDTRSVIYGAAAPSAKHTGWRAVVNGVTGAETYGWLSSAPLPTAIPLWSGAELASLTLAATIPVSTPTAAQYDAGEALLQVGTELMAYRTVTANADGTTTFGQVARAVLDTVPRAHAAGARVFVLGTAVRFPLDLPSDGAVAVAALTSTASDTLSPEEASSVSITTASRALRPYPPGRVAINGTVYGEGPHTYPATISWEPRTRAATTVVRQDATGQPAEADSYHVQVFAADGVTLLESHQTAAASLEITSSGSVVVEVFSRRGTVYSTDAHRIPCTIAVPPAGLLAEDNGKLTTEAGDRIIQE